MIPKAPASTVRAPRSRPQVHAAWRLAIAMSCLVGALAPAPALSSHTSGTPERSAMPPTDSARAHVEADGVVLETVFVREGAGLRVDYRLRNTGAQALMVFDRGDRHAVLTRRQKAGDVGAPRLETRDGDRAVLSHVARALPKPAPTVPPTPLARRVEPGEQVGASVAFANWLDAPAQVQWCIGVAVADDARLSSPDATGAVEVWQADFGYADDQQVLCTPWFDMARGTFDR